MACGGCGYRAIQISAAARAVARLDSRGAAIAVKAVVRSAATDASRLAGLVRAQALALVEGRR